MQLTRWIQFRAPDADGSSIVVLELAQSQNIGGALLGAGARPIAIRNRVQVNEGEARRPGRADGRDQLRLDRRGPAADHLDQRCVEPFGIGQGDIFLELLGVADERQVEGEYGDRRHRQADR